ncbi:hypothetical protein BIFDEN_01423 [Bifidobacterium dentium ATCC 27678]|nr:hypothetical protein BIFDEN_01423 [Bifidobacterium dentium ATCC 27678]
MARPGHRTVREFERFEGRLSRSCRRESRMNVSHDPCDSLSFVPNGPL